jgi:hypothetical protein
MIRKQMMFGLAMAGLAIAPARPAMAAAVSLVQDFNNLNLSFTTFRPAGYNTSLFFSDGSDRAVEFNYTRTGPTTEFARLQAVSTVMTFNPAMLGRIDNIDASIAMRSAVFANGQAVNLSTLPNRLRLIAQQDGKTYIAVHTAPGPTGANGVYRPAAKTGFLAADFHLFDPMNFGAPLGGTGLDFGGSTIAFGFEIVPPRVVDGSGQPFTGTSASVTDVNGFEAVVNYAPRGAVPEPANWALLIGGFGIAGAAARRRAKNYLMVA